MNKEDCLKALQFLYAKATNNASGYCGKETPYVHSLIMLYDLIDSHFDNPPLKFEWFRNKDNYYKPFYDSKEKEWHIFTMRILNHESFYVDYILRDMDFEENRFYRYEVKENVD